MSVKMNGRHLAKFVADDEFDAIFPQVSLAHETLHGKTGPGSDFLGWVDLPVDYDKEEFARIKKAAAKIQSDSDVLVVIGIGGIATLGVGLVPLAWGIPMTVRSWGVYKGKKPNTVALGVCTLLFLNMVSGILLLVAQKDK